MLEPAREAFTQGLQVAATVSGVLLAAAAILFARLLRQGAGLQEDEPGATASAAVPTHDLDPAIAWAHASVADA